jgi:threonine-phosphate decarboxylase
MTNQVLRHGGDIFEVAKRRGIPWTQILDFSASINPLGPSPRANEAIISSLDRIAHYPSLNSPDLRHRLAQEWKIKEEQILTGNGAADLLRDFCACFGNGHLAVPAFTEFHRLWPNAPLCKIDDLKSWPAEGTLVLTRPVNPTGQLIEAGLVIEYLRGSQTVVLVDESFIDFSMAGSLIEYTCEFPRLLVLRSLTKFQALPGLRVGALAGHPGIIARLSEMRPPWAVNALAERAALAVLDDHEHAEATREFVRQERAWFTQQVEARPNVHVWPSEANYIYVEAPYATKLVEFAWHRDILIRDCTGWPGCERSALRIAVRPRRENERLVAVWKEFACDHL